MNWRDGIDDEQWRPLAGPSGGIVAAALMDAEAALDAAERRAAELSRGIPGGTRLREQVEQELVAAAARLRGPADRRRTLRDAIARWRAELGRPPELRRIAPLAERLAAAYAALLIDEFRAEFDVEFAAENPQEEARWKEAEKAAREVERLRRELDKARKAADPTALRQHLRFDPPSGGVLRLLRAFVETWRARAALFAVPVTLHGVRIDSLPDERQAEWQRAYEKCGCRPGTGDGLAVPETFRRQEAATAAVPKVVPAMFSEKG